MKQSDYDIFISYRRVGGAHYARILKAELEKRGYNDRVFLDYDELVDGKFDDRIKHAIETAPVFIFILSPGSLDRCINSDDWVRQEIIYAFECERHIIPINFDGLFSRFPSQVPPQIKNILGQHQFSKIDSEQLLNVSIEKLIKERIAPVMHPNVSYSTEQRQNKGAEVVILSDCACDIYRFGKLIGRVEENSELGINLIKGNHLLEFVSVDDPTISEKKKYSIPDNDYSDYIEVKLKERIKNTTKNKKENDDTGNLNPDDKSKNDRTTSGSGGPFKKIKEWFASSFSESQALDKYNQALKYYNEGPNQDYMKAFQLFSESAEMGHADAQFYLGLMYANGRGVTKNDSEAVKWYRKAADQGDEDAQCNLGFMYANGRGVSKNDSEAVKWYRKAADQGLASAQCNLGLMYDYGRGVTKNDSEAVKWYRKAADQGYASAQCNLGLMYEYGRGVTKNDSEAVKWYRKAADQGLASAQCNLGFMYANGQGVSKNDSEAVKWYRKAADQGYASAQCNLGFMYANGRGVSKNDSEAVKWYRKAADQGYASAQCNLGFMYANGRGVTKNDSEAVKWYRKAADQGYASAQCNLGFMYANGRGVSKNDSEAVKWYRKAADQGDEDAINILKQKGIYKL